MANIFDGTSGDVTAGGPGTVVGANVKLTGTISDVNDIVIHGTVEGEVISDKTITITETASVKGPVTGQLVSVSGKVNGAITAHEKLELQPTADVSGSLSTKELIIKSGAIFNGKSSMVKNDGLGGKTSMSDDAPIKKTDKAPEKSEDEKETEEPIQLPAARSSAPAVEIEE